VDARAVIFEYFIPTCGGGGMTQPWLLARTLAPVVLAFCRDLITLCCHVVRRTSIERIISAAPGRILILDRTADGATLVVDVKPTVALKSSRLAAKDSTE
jgi:hypothetical protein